MFKANKEQDKVNKEIMNYIKDNRDKICEPIQAYVTFNKIEDKRFYEKAKNSVLFDKAARPLNALIPSDLIYENRESLFKNNSYMMLL